MAGGFVIGVFWGIVVMGAGLTVLSQVAPPPVSARAEPVAVVVDEAAETAAAATAALAKAAAEKVAAEKAAADKAAADRVATEAAADKAAAEKVAAERAAADIAARHKAATEVPLAESTPAPAAVAPEVAGESPAIIAASEALPGPDAPLVKEEVPSLTGLDQALTVPAPEPAPAPVEAAPARPEGPKDALLVPGQPAGQDEVQRLPQIAPVAEPDLAPDLAPEPPVVAAEPSQDAPPKASPAATIRDDQPTLPAVKRLQDKLPTTVLDKTVAGVKVDGLPQIGVVPEVEPAVAADLPPVQRFARAFEPEDKPLFVILLHDVGAAGMAREELAKLPFAVSFVVDPLAPDARAASAAYRAAGQEVLTLANGIPPGAKASDLETTFQTLSSILPESVAIVDQDLGGFQDQRPLATLVLPVIKGEGRGLVTYDRGLNAADQIARREGVPAAVIFRRLDGDGENKSTIRRYLDRAAFKAAQEGAVVVIGDTSESTVAAILEWTIEGRAATVTLAPVTAVLGR